MTAGSQLSVVDENPKGSAPHKGAWQCKIASRNPWDRRRLAH